MVIVLTGMQTINKKVLSRIVLATLNKFEYQGYTANFIRGDFTIYDSNGVAVYRPANDTDGGIDTLFHDPKGKSVIDYFSKMDSDVFEDMCKHNHFLHVFSSLDVDWGLTNRPKYIREGSSKLLHPHAFMDVINNIKESPFEVKVITGTFGSHFLTRLQAALPNEEIHVVNLIRNPSVAWLMHKKPETKWETEINPDLTEEGDYERFFIGALNSIELMKNPKVKTVKFEDVMHSAILPISKDISIDMREDYQQSNGWLNNYEAQLEVLMSDEEFNEFNPKALNYTFEDYYHPADDVNEEEVYSMPIEELKSRISKKFPINIFEQLGYEPLTKEEILK